MYLFDAFTLLLTGLMIGNELAVSVFTNRAIWQLEEPAQARALSLLARALGRVMPFWYGLCLASLLFETYLHRNQPAFHFLLGAACIWVAVVIYTIAVLVPINKRIASLAPASLPANWLADHRKWDRLHRWRIIFLIVAMSLLACALVSARS
jgi:uncharacterized membrane protein